MCEDIKLNLELPSGLVSFSERGVSLLVSLEIPFTVKFKQDGTQGTAELYSDEVYKAVIPSNQSRNALIGTIRTLEKKIKIMKNNHEDLKKRNQLLRDRPDLPLDRLSAHRDMEKLQNRVAQLEQTVYHKDNAIKRLQRRLAARGVDASDPEPSPSSTGVCPVCSGLGRYRVIVNERNPYLTVGTETEVTCHHCHGRGKL